MLDWEVLHRHSMGVDQWGTRGTLTTPRLEGVSIGNVLILFQFIKQIYRHISEPAHSPLLKTLHRTSSKINTKNQNFRLPSGKSLDKLLGWQQPATWSKSNKYSSCRALSFCTLVFIYSHQAHNRLLIFVCPVTPWIAAWSPWWIFISPTAEPDDLCTLCNLISF